MALYARGPKGYIFCKDALKEKTYSCIECGSPLKLRPGRYFPHFYHVTQSKTCRLHSKSEDHLIVQLQLKKILSGEIIDLEKPFLNINRVADLVWERRKLIFEIQCSTLNFTEIDQRIFDYAQKGYNVIWLLDDRVFNRKNLLFLEERARLKGAYFFKFSKLRSFFYDQFELFYKDKRVKKGKPLLIDLKYPKQPPKQTPSSKIPLFLSQRIAMCRIYFAKDLIDRAFTYGEKGFGMTYWKSLEKSQRIKNHFLYKFFLKYFKKPAERLLNLLLKSTKNRRTY